MEPLAKTLLNGEKSATPINQEFFDQTGEVRLNQSFRNTIELTSYFRLDASIYYRLNRPKAAHRISLDIQNVKNRLNVDTIIYDGETGQICTNYQLELTPFVNYRIEF